ncbi:MAG TPA: DUF4158 domain-containing protein, partial [Thermomicrobiales bacterium]
MRRRSALSAAQLAAVLAPPVTATEIAQHYTLDERDLAIIRQRRGAQNRLGFALQLCFLRYPGQAMAPESEPSAAMLSFVSRQVHASPEAWTAYAQRDETRREHASELQITFGYRPFTVREYRQRRGAP